MREKCFAKASIHNCCGEHAIYSMMGFLRQIRFVFQVVCKHRRYNHIITFSLLRESEEINLVAGFASNQNTPAPIKTSPKLKAVLYGNQTGSRKRSDKNSNAICCAGKRISFSPNLLPRVVN